MLDEICRDIDARLRGRPEYAHTSHFLVIVDGPTVYDAHYRGPRVADVFSVTKSIVATLAGIAVRRGHLPDLDLPIEAVLDVADSPSAGQTLAHLLTMTRGAQTWDEYDTDEVMGLPSGWVERMAAAPRIAAPGTRFHDDDGAAHLFGAALARLVGTSLSEYAAAELFEPLGVREWHWPRDPDGLDYGFAHVRLSAADLGALGRLWMDHGVWEGGRLVDPGFAARTVSPHSAGGWPEERPYGYFIWIDEHGPFAAGWAGQHVTVVPAARAVIVTTGDPRFDPGPPPAHELPPDWRPAHHLVTERLVPVLLDLG
jgi:CubicO group peptidase (beta-lactamase class C family)